MAKKKLIEPKTESEPTKIHYIGLHPRRPGYQEVVRKLEEISNNILENHLLYCLELIKLRNEIYEGLYDLDRNQQSILVDAVEDYRKFLTENL